jgi:hypothetical protein
MRILMAGTGSGGEENFLNTVLAPVDLEHYASSLTAEQRQLLHAEHGRFARMWGIPKGDEVAGLELGDQVWFHRDNYVNYVADVVIVFDNLEFDRALWSEDYFPASGFVFTLDRLLKARISKVSINELLGYKPRFTWQGNRLLSREQSRLLASSVCITLCDNVNED